MDDASAESVLDWSHATNEIPSRGLEQSRRATPEELLALASYLDIPAVERLEVAYRILPITGGRYRLAGSLSANVVQSCIVTLDPVPAPVEDRIDVVFRPAVDAKPESGSGPDAELSALEAEEEEPIDHNRLAIGRVVVETLAAALPAYPRAPGAELEQREAGPAGGGTTSPFAALADWKPRKP